MELFHFKDYRDYVRFRLSKDGGSFGTLSELAKVMKTRVSHLSQMLKGTRNLSHEQAHFMALAFKLSETETLYLNEMIHLERATDPTYRKQLSQRMRSLKNAGHSTILPEKNQAIFYSSWIYSAVQLATGLPDMDTAEKIAKHFGLSIEAIRHALHLLVEIGLCGTDGVHYHPTAKKRWSTNDLHFMADIKSTGA